ncbi:glycerophosphodiester phosphodiesterase [Arcanobacterium phocisimile]|uniref:Glycerophosphodiester phosphodiesterase n=1 Tax=Arcanobacterium phocisimile TaxID=1302235 RepID=A0ABX7II24_9ACTO|nr:glycerophosphodiester phosphodiesterase family protein [Arcanobacterium phocisimile]QRV02500.1 glycerophosphodiester phosphodiesterase [Arcanobacterium phocisimile]
MTQSRLWGYASDPVLIAHRGGGQEAPENSRQAFSRLNDLGLSHIETDVHSTKDSVAVVIHDPILDRVSDGHGRVSQYTWDELRRYRDHSGQPLMRLDEALDEFSHLVFNIDAKENRVIEPLISAIKHTGAQKRVSLASFSERRLVQLRQKLPGVSSSMGISAVAKLIAAANVPGSLRSAILRLLPAADDGVHAVQVPESFRGIKIVDEKFVELVHSLKMAVHVWTVNDEEHAAQLVDLGVDGIITDIPSALRHIV